MHFLIVSQYLVNRLLDLSFAEYLRALAVAMWVLEVLARYRNYAAPEGLGALILAWEICREYWNHFRVKT